MMIGNVANIHKHSHTFSSYLIRLGNMIYQSLFWWNFIKYTVIYNLLFSSGNIYCSNATDACYEMQIYLTSAKHQHRRVKLIQFLHHTHLRLQDISILVMTRTNTTLNSKLDTVYLTPIYHEHWCLEFQNTTTLWCVMLWLCWCYIELSWAYCAIMAQQWILHWTLFIVFGH